MNTPDRPDLLDLITHAESVEGHLTLHANFTPTSSRHPHPDWSAQVIWIVTDERTGQSEPASIYGTGATPVEAAQAALAILPPPTQEPPHADLD